MAFREEGDRGLVSGLSLLLRLLPIVTLRHPRVRTAVALRTTERLNQGIL